MAGTRIWAPAIAILFLLSVNGIGFLPFIDYPPPHQRAAYFVIVPGTLVLQIGNGRTYDGEKLSQTNMFTATVSVFILASRFPKDFGFRLKMLLDDISLSARLKSMPPSVTVRQT